MRLRDGLSLIASGVAISGMALLAVHLSRPAPPPFDCAAVPRRGASRLGPNPAGAWWRPAVSGALALAAALEVLGLIWLLARPLALLFAAIVLGEALEPAITWLARWMPRSLAIAPVYLGLLVVAGLVGWMVVPRLVEEGSILASQVPELLGRARALVDRLDPTAGDRVIGAVEPRLLDTASRLASSLVLLPLVVLGSLLDIVLVVMLSVYWLVAAPTLERFALSLVPPQQREPARAVLRAVGRIMGATGGDRCWTRW